MIEEPEITHEQQITARLWCLCQEVKALTTAGAQGDAHECGRIIREIHRLSAELVPLFDGMPHTVQTSEEA